MSGPVNLNGMKTASPPNAFGAILWFRDTDNRLQRMPVARPSAVTNPLGFKAASEPMPSPDGYIFFQGTDNKLWMMQQQTPYLNVNLGGFECKSPPICAGDGWGLLPGHGRQAVAGLQRRSVDQSQSRRTEMHFDAGGAAAPQRLPLLPGPGQFALAGSI